MYLSNRLSPIRETHFSLAEIVLDEARESATDRADASIEDNIPAYRRGGPAVTQPGDLWILGRHKVICGDARETAAYAALLGDEVVDLICTDPPYNVPIDGHVWLRADPPPQLCDGRGRDE